MAERATLAKSNIEPVTITVTLTATKINENGTFSGWKGVEISSKSHPKAEFKTAIPFQGGGSVFFQLAPSETLASAGVKLSKATVAAKDATPRKKLF